MWEIMITDRLPVEKLTEILLTEFDKEELEPELCMYKGDFATRVLEYCLDNDPAEIVKKMFGLPRLRKLMEAHNIPVKNISNDTQLVNCFLNSLGFNIAHEFVGIKEAISKAKKCQQNLAIVREKEKIGLMIDLYNELERILKDIFLFYFRFLYRKDLEKESIDTLLSKVFNVSKPIEKLGLGEFISLLRQLNKIISESEEFKNNMQKTFERNCVLSKTNFKILDDVSRYRKFFAHYKGKIPSIEQCEDIVANISILLGEFKTAIIYPDLIRINEIVVNRFGVRCVRAEDEFGGLWKIYTDVPLDVGKIYFVYSKTGQITINPILLEKI